MSLQYLTQTASFPAVNSENADCFPMKKMVYFHLYIKYQEGDPVTNRTKSNAKTTIVRIVCLTLVGLMIFSVIASALWY